MMEATRRRRTALALASRISLFVALVLTAAAGAASAEKGGADSSSGPVPLPRVFVLDGPALATARARAAAGDKTLAEAVADLRRDADKALKAGPFSVTDKKETPPSGDKHDYMSVGPYWWPDPSKPDGKPYIRRDGEVNADRGKFDNVPLGHMAGAVAVLGPAWYFTGHEPYAAHAARLLRAWFLDEKTRMNPNLNYGQAIPGVTDGRAAGIIDTVCLIDLVDAVGLLAGAKAWTDADQKALEGWFREYLKWLRESRIGKDEEKAGNNHGTWYDAQAAGDLAGGREPGWREVLLRPARTIDKGGGP
jgi:hypothetical protein